MSEVQYNITKFITRITVNGFMYKMHKSLLDKLHLGKRLNFITERFPGEKTV